MHGHTLGAAGAIEGAATVLAWLIRLFPPTANFTEPDPACDLDVVPNQARSVSVEYALFEFVRVWRLERGAGVQSGRGQYSLKLLRFAASGFYTKKRCLPPIVMR